MIEKIIKEMNKKYYLKIHYSKKYYNVYDIFFNIENKEISFTFMHNILGMYEDNLKAFEERLNKEIINFYIRKEN